MSMAVMLQRHQDAGDKAHDQGLGVDRELERLGHHALGGTAQKCHHAETHRQTESTAYDPEDQRLEQEHRGDLSAPQSDGLEHADLEGAATDDNQHGVGDTDTADQQ